MLTYGDGVADIPIDRLLAFHESHGRLATVTAVRPPSRFGALALDGDSVADFSEKPQAEAGWINGGFFIFEHAVCRPSRRRRHGPGARTPGGPRPGRTADGLSPSRVLGTDGHRARPEQPWSASGPRAPHLGRSGMTDLARYAGTCVFVTGASGIVGSWLVRAMLSAGASVVALVRDEDPQV